MRTLATLGALACLACTACGPRGLPQREHQVLVSPEGWAQAYVAVYAEGHNQVVIDFDNGCGTGATAIWAPTAEIRLRWVDASTLEVEYPRGARFERSVSGERLRCWNRTVLEVLVPR